MSERGNRILKFLDFAAGVPLAGLTSAVRLPAHRLPENPRLHIAVLCLGAIGDLLLLSGLLDGLRRQIPSAFLEVISSTANAAALPLLPEVDSARAFPVSKPLAILKYLRKQKLDLLIDSSQWSRIGNVLANLSGAKVTAGFWNAGQRRGLGYDYKAVHSNEAHEKENFLSLGRALWPAFAGSPRLRAPVWQKSGQNEILCHLWPAPGRGRTLKEWPEAAWHELITALLEGGFTVGLTGSGADLPQTERFVNSFFAARPGVRILAGQLTLPQLAAHMADCAALVSVNTGIMHLGSLTGLPTVGLHGPTNPLRWGPCGPRSIALLPETGENAYLNLGFEYPRNAVNNLQNLSVQSVLDALHTLEVL